MRPPGCGTIGSVGLRDPFGGERARPDRAMNATDPPGWHGIDRWPGRDLTRCRLLRRMSQPRCNAAPARSNSSCALRRYGWLTK